MGQGGGGAGFLSRQRTGVGVGSNAQRRERGHRLGGTLAASVTAWEREKSPAGNSRAECAARRKGRTGAARAELFRQSRTSHELSGGGRPRMADRERSGGISLSSTTMSFQKTRTILDSQRVAKSLRLGGSQTQSSLGRT